MKSWTPSQLKVLIPGLTVVALYLGIRLWLAPVPLSDPVPNHGARQPEVRNRVDPNTADWPTLAALPAIGPERAREIIAWRDEYQRTHPNETPFKTIQDLSQVKGIGEGTVRSLAQYLVIPE